MIDGALPAVSVQTAQGIARLGQNGQFTISRSNVSDGPFTIGFATTTTTGTATLAKQGVDYVLKDAAGHTLSSSITFAAGQKDFAVFVVALDSGKTNITLSA